MICAIPLVPSCTEQQFFELFFCHASLLSAQLLDVHAKDAGPFGEVVDVAPGFEQFKNVTVFQGLALFRRNAELIAVGVLITQIAVTVFSGIERKAHFVQRVASHGALTVEDKGARNVLIACFFESHITSSRCSSSGKVCSKFEVTDSGRSIIAMERAAL